MTEAANKHIEQEPNQTSFYSGDYTKEFVYVAIAPREKDPTSLHARSFRFQRRSILESKTGWWIPELSYVPKKAGSPESKVSKHPGAVFPQVPWVYVFLDVFLDLSWD